MPFTITITITYKYKSAEYSLPEGGNTAVRAAFSDAGGIADLPGGGRA